MCARITHLIEVEMACGAIAFVQFLQVFWYISHAKFSLPHAIRMANDGFLLLLHQLTR